jgi:hypothetical protein
MSPEQARDTLVSTVEETSTVLDVSGWARTGAPEVGNCGDRPGERANYNYGYSAPPQSRDFAADAQKVAEHWKSLGMEVRVVDSPSVVVYATGGLVEGLSFSTGPGNYYIVGTSLCVPGDASELRKKRQRLSCESAPC